MVSSPILDPFTQIHPGQFLVKYQDWVLFTLLLFFFWSVIGIALKKRFENSRHLRFLVTTTALMMTCGTYFSIYQGWLYFSFQGLGLIGVILILIVIFFIIFGLVKGYGMKTNTALPLGFTLFYLGMWAISPNIFQNLSDIFPLSNTILLIVFFASVFKTISSFFKHSRQDPLMVAKNLEKSHFITEETAKNDQEIKQEIKEDKQENKQIKKKTMKVTKVEIKKLEDIEKYLLKMGDIIKNKGNSINQEETAQLTKTLRAIYKNETILKQGLMLIQRHVRAYRAIHKKDIPELEKRLKNPKNKEKIKIIQEEIYYQKKMLQALDFMNKYESRINDFIQSFNRLIFTAIQKLKNHYPKDTLSYLHMAHNNLTLMKHVYDKQRDIEKYLIRCNKKTIKDLKKEQKKD